MFLLKLPDELLLVTSYFNYESDINSLARTTRQLYYLLNPYLYRHNARYGNGSALEWAFRYSHATVARRMLREGALLSEYLHEDWEPLTVAWTYGPDAAVKILQEEGDEDVLVRESGPKIDRLSMVLAHNPQVMLQCLISLGETFRRCPTVIPMGDGFLTMLMNDAIIFRNIEVVKFLIEHFPDIINGEDQEDSRFDHPWHKQRFTGAKKLFVSCLMLEQIQTLISESAGQTAVYYAVKNDDIETTQLLLDNGAHADPRILNHSDDDWHSLITLYWATGNKAITELLLQHIDLEEKMTAASVLDRDILMIASAACGLIAVVKRILDRKSHGDTKPWGSRTFLHWDRCNSPPLTWATFGGHKDIVALLLDHGADPYGRIPALTLAITLRRAEIVELLLNRGTDFNSRTCTISHKSEAICSLGICTLYCAIRFPRAFQVLTEKGALVQDDSSGLVSLMAEVVKSGNVALVQVLLDKGVSLKYMNRIIQRSC